MFKVKRRHNQKDEIQVPGTQPELIEMFGFTQVDKAWVESRVMLEGLGAYLLGFGLACDLIQSIRIVSVLTLLFSKLYIWYPPFI